MTAIIYLVWQGYWLFAEIEANNKKAKSHKLTGKEFVKWWISLLSGLFVFAQLVGLSVLPFQYTIPLQLVGFILVLIGIGVSFAARFELGHNWTHAADYQIKKEHELVTSGVYRYMRHPIYTGLIVAVIGTELIVHSFLVIPLTVLMVLAFYYQAQEEEKILTKHFGKAYEKYKKTSSMLIPFVI